MTTKVRTDISIIIVSYNSWAYLEPCLKSIKEKLCNITYEVIVVDNDSQDETVPRLRVDFPEVLLIRNEGNLGFGVANNRGALKAKGDYLFLLNADTLLLDQNIIHAIQYARENNIAILGPKMVGEKGELQVTWDTDVSLWRYIRSIASMGLLLGKLFKRTTHEPDGPIAVGFLVGAAMLIQRSAYDRLGLFDERFFFTCEERDLCMRYQNAGLMMAYYPDWCLLHYGGSGTPMSEFQLWNWAKASRQLVEKHGSTKQCFFFHVSILLFLVSYSAQYFFRSFFGVAQGRERSRTFRKVACKYIGFD